MEKGFESHYFVKNDETKDRLWNALSKIRENLSLKEEIVVLETSFGNPVTIVKAPFYFFSLINQYLSRKYMEQLSNLGKKLDAMLAKVFPNLNHFSFHQILVFKKNTRKNKAAYK